MRQFTAVLVVLSVVTSCSDDAGYGEVCKNDTDCKSKLCVEYLQGKDKRCSKTCKNLKGCPVYQGEKWDCGKVPSGKIVCYPRSYHTGKYAQGYDCSLDGRCNTKGSKCMGQPGDTDRYCADPCKTDVECPPKYRCAMTRTGKDLDKEKRCLRRQFCHPCVIDDQCGDEKDLCINDSKGRRYCSRSCTKTGVTCPLYAKCEDAGNSKLQCRHKAGYCQKSFNADGDFCDPCIIHGWEGSPLKTIAEEGICKKEGFCFLYDRYSGDSACIMPCQTGEKCPTKQQCYKIDSLGGKFCLPIKTEGGKILVGTCFP